MMMEELFTISKQRTHPDEMLQKFHGVNRSKNGTTALDTSGRNKKYMIMKKKGFTLVELMVVMAMTAIMIGVVLVSLDGARDRKNVEVEARKLAAVIREAQNYALTGKQFVSGRVTCSVGVRAIGDGDEGYIVSYAYRSGTDCSDSPTAATWVTNSLLNGVRFASTTDTFSFVVPRGEVNLGGNPNPIPIQVSKNSATWSVCVYSGGRVVEAAGASCP